MRKKTNSDQIHSGADRLLHMYTLHIFARICNNIMRGYARSRTYANAFGVMEYGNFIRNMNDMYVLSCHFTSECDGAMA